MTYDTQLFISFPTAITTTNNVAQLQQCLYYYYNN